MARPAFMAGLLNSSEERRAPQPIRRLRHGRFVAAALVGLVLAASPADAQVNIDGGRSDLPGMKQDMFDRVQKDKNKGQKKPAKIPDCPKSDKMSPWFGLAFANHEMYVRLNGTDGECERLITIGGANYSELTNASKTCGPAGEWKKRIAEELSAVFFQGGFEWVKSENETIEIVTETGTYQIEVNENKYEEMLNCWARACECEQAKNPVARMILMACLAIALSGFGYDALKLAFDKIMGKKPPKHVLSKKGHRMIEVKYAPRNYCDMCGIAGTTYQCSGDSNYDLCKNCYKKEKKKVKDEFDAWLAKHPDDPDAKKEKKEKKKKDSDKEDEEKSEKSGAEDGETSTKPESGADSESEKTGTEATASEKGDN